MRRSLLGECLVAQSRFPEAEALIVPAHPRMLEELGPGHPWTVDVSRRLVELYEAWGKPEKADPYRVTAAGEP